MIRPIIATKNPYDAAEDFRKCGWKIDFQTPKDGNDPLSGVSLYGNTVLLGTMDEKYVNAEAASYIGTGVEIHIVIPAESIHEAFNNHLHLNPSKLELQSWGETGFLFNIQGYHFMVIATT